MIKLAAPLVALLATAAAAEIIPPAEFEALSEGRTLTFDKGGTFYGAEQYGPNRYSLWQDATGDCAEGSWFPAGDAICFVYDRQPEPICWIFERRDGDYFARVAGTPPRDASEIRLREIIDEPLSCPAPDLGV